jgi:translation initiation factor IF-3
MYQKNFNQDPRVNERIRLSPVLVISETGENLGSMSVANAIALARTQGLDLIEVSPNVRPPVCRIMDFGKFKYDKAVKERQNKKNSKQIEMKEIRFRPVTADHDLEIKIKSARGFLENGHAVLLKLKFEKRELQFKDRGFSLVKKITDSLSDVGIIRTPASLQGKFITCVLNKK